MTDSKQGSTLVNHPPEAPVPEGNRPLVPPIYQSVKFEFDDLEHTLEFLRGDRPGYFYTRASNPTSRQLEMLCAQMQGRDDCLVTSSGVAAISHTLLALTKQGDHVLCFVETYNPTRYLIRRLLGRFGVTCTMLSIEDLAGMERVLSSTPTRLVVFESPTNPMTKVADIEAITRMAHAHGALTVLDNTFAGLHQHGEYPIDIFVHSLTKYASGTGDVMGGAVIARTDIIRAMRNEFSTLGGMLDPHAAWLMLRGLKTYYVRYHAQAERALAVARMLAGQPQVTKVHYPGLESHPQYALANKQMREFGTIVTLDLKSAEAASEFADALKLFAITASLGATESLVVPPQMMSGRDLSAEQSRVSGITNSTVRLSIGLEELDDLLADLRQALAAAAKAGTPAAQE